MNGGKAYKCHLEYLARPQIKPGTRMRVVVEAPCDVTPNVPMSIGAVDIVKMPVSFCLESAKPSQKLCTAPNQ